MDNSSYPLVSVNIGLTLGTPANATSPVPVIMQFGRGGPPPDPNAAAAPNPCTPPGAGPGRVGTPGAAAPGRAAAAGPGRGPAFAGRGPAGPTWQQQVLAKGWGYAMLDTNSIQADNGCGLTQGIIGLVNKGQPRKMDDWGSLKALGWGASRALDYFETDKAVDAAKVGLEGHSRWGKATLVAMAFDERFAVAYVSSSGEGGAKLHRRKYGELVENLTAANEYHWMAGNFMKYAGHWDDLPVDSHELVALCAPRPVFLSAGKGPDTNPDGSIALKPVAPASVDPTTGRAIPAVGPGTALAINDAWVDAKGTFLAGVGAGPVYRLLGKKDLGTTTFPPIETSLVNGTLAFRQHSSGHTDVPNWPYFLDFAARQFKARAR